MDCIAHSEDVKEFCIVKLDSYMSRDLTEFQSLENSDIFCFRNNFIISEYNKSHDENRRKKKNKFPFCISLKRCMSTINTEECVISLCETTDGVQLKIFKLLSSYGDTLHCGEDKSPSLFDPEVVITLDSYQVQERMEKKLLYCTHCNYSTRRKDHYKQHCFIHTENFPFNCLYCDFQTRHKQVIKYHVKRHTGEKNFKCLYCDYACIRKSDLPDHIRTHTGSRPYACTLCDSRFMRKRDLNGHMTWHISKKKYYCSECTYVTKQKLLLYKHIKYKHNEKKFQCHICSYASTQKCDLKKHLIIHSHAKSLECYLCDYKTSRTSDLNKHLKIHNKVKPYKCPYCSFSSRQGGDLSSHIQNHSKPSSLSPPYRQDLCISEKPVSTPKCNKDFYSHELNRNENNILLTKYNDLIKSESDVEIHPMDDDDHTVMCF